MPVDPESLIGQHIYFKAQMLVPVSVNIWTAESQSFSRGDALLVTAEVVEANTDRTGFCWLALADDPEGQLARWGHEAFRLGLPPADLKPWTDTRDPRYAEAFYAARRALHAVPDAERRDALAQFRREFPVAPAHDDQHIATYRR